MLSELVAFNPFSRSRHGAVCMHPHSLDSDSSTKSNFIMSYSVERGVFFQLKSVTLKAWCQSLQTGIKWPLLCLWVNSLSVKYSFVIIFHPFFLHVLIQALLRRCRQPPLPWTSSSSSSQTIASKTWSSRQTCTPRSSRSASAQMKAGVLSQPRRLRPSWALSPPPACIVVSRCSASGAQASSATGASPWRWARHASRRFSNTSTSWLSGRHREATRACTRSSPSWTRCSSRSAAPSDLHKHRCVHSQSMSPGNKIGSSLCIYPVYVSHSQTDPQFTDFAEQS